MKNTISFKSYFRDIEKDIDKVKDERYIKAGRHVAKKMKEKAGDIWAKGTGPKEGEPPAKRSGNLVKGIGYEQDTGSVFVGVGPPAYHAHLLEFGTLDRKRKDDGFSGKVEPRPFIFPTFEEETPEIKKILSETWL